MPHARRLGTEFEDEAAQHLLRKGLTLLTRRYKAGGGEIDIVALDGETLVFVEVKARRSPTFKAEESLTPLKKSRIIAAARRFLEDYDGPNRPVRFDLVAIDARGVSHFPDAFEPE